MSLGLNKLGVVKVEDARLEVSNNWKYPVRISGNNIGNLSVQASSLAPGSVQFAILPPNPGGSVVSPRMYWENTVTFQINVAAGGAGNLIQAGVFDAPASFPITRCVDSATIQINNETFSYSNWRAVRQALQRFNTRSLLKDANFTPCMADQASTYEALFGSLRDPISSAQAGDWDFTRGAYSHFEVLASTPTSATVRLYTVEPINLPPFVWSDEQGIPYAQQIQVTLNVPNFYPALSHSISATGQNAVIPDSAIVATHNSSRLYYTSVAANLLENPIPASVSLPIYKILQFTSPRVPVPCVAATAGNPPAGSQIVSPTIQLPCIPSRIYVFAAPAVTTEVNNTPDLLATYTGGLSLNWCNRTNLMSTLTREQLYAQAQDAGFNNPWQQWSGAYRLTAGNATGVVGGTGSVICIIPGRHFELASNEAVGQLGSYQLQVQANFYVPKTVVGNTVDCTLYVVAVLDSVMTLTSGFETSVQTGVVSQKDILETVKEKVDENDLHETFGSGMFGNDKRKVKSHGMGLLTAGSSLTAGGASMYGGATMSKKSIESRLY